MTLHTNRETSGFFKLLIAIIGGLYLLNHIPNIGIDLDYSFETSYTYLGGRGLAT
jgi:hypothetical protein